MSEQILVPIQFSPLGGAEVIAIEPIPSTFQALRRNILLNEFGDRIQALNIGLGKESALNNPF